MIGGPGFSTTLTFVPTGPGTLCRVSLTALASLEPSVAGMVMVVVVPSPLNQEDLSVLGSSLRMFLFLYSGLPSQWWLYRLFSYLASILVATNSLMSWEYPPQYIWTISLFMNITFVSHGTCREQFLSLLDPS